MFEQWTWDQDLREWRSRLQWNNGLYVEVSFSPDEMSVTADFRIVHEQWNKLNKRWRELEECVADHLLDIHNENWNEGEPIDRNAFVSRMTIEAIRFFADGKAEVYFDDGDLFWGHCILVSVDENGQVEDAVIAG